MSEYELRQKLRRQDDMRREYVAPDGIQAIRWWNHFFNRYPLFAKEMADEAEKKHEIRKSS
jgi:hypothetical protein